MFLSSLLFLFLGNRLSIKKKCIFTLSLDIRILILIIFEREIRLKFFCYSFCDHKKITTYASLCALFVFFVVILISSNLCIAYHTIVTLCIRIYMHERINHADGLLWWKSIKTTEEKKTIRERNIYWTRQSLSRCCFLFFFSYWSGHWSE